jgi:mRNA interferase RelE/StbE
MKVEFDSSFLKSLEKIKNKQVLEKISRKIIEFENAGNLREIPNITKLSGYSNYYRIRIGNYRIGIELMNHDTIRFIIVADRKDIYKHFP